MNPLYSSDQKRSRTTLREIVNAKDIMLYTGRCAETARRILRQVREVLGKNIRDHVSVKELCQVKNYSEEEFRNILRTPLSYYFFVFGMIYLFRNDMDVYTLWLLVIAVLQVEFVSFKQWIDGMRRWLMGCQ